MDKGDYMKLKSSAQPKKWSLNGRDHPEWEKIFASYTSQD
jgi:hypothetical protein